MSCKPIDWYEVDHDFVEVPRDAATYTAEELGIDKCVSNEFKIPKRSPPIFMVTRRVTGKTLVYVVDTQGYNYARYIRRIS